MTGSPIRDADVSVLTLPREEPPSPRHTRSWLKWLAGGTGLCTGVAVFYWVSPQLSPLPEVDTAPVRMVDGHVPASPLTTSGYVVAQRQASVASKGTGRLEYLASPSEAMSGQETSSRECSKTTSWPFNIRHAHAWTWPERP